eukprot:CAMPEP_0194342008 /NCGR_PEP_ID=MMETSP0171-20130528/91468_1 /TAXON_ID=218684 /ORGANISM="Corethron pennatum, Strain L29A3" /LENGTH=58 /DNA_ID=CAMNT_0039107559 /DNA_START=28 /DNA_END=204 /DNA_ORIENTATION=-
MDKEILRENVISAQRTVELVVLRDERPKEPKDMEVAVRIRCAVSVHNCFLHITHLYWA